MKIFPSDKIREIDAFTIAHEPIASIDLMERAARTLFEEIAADLKKDTHLIVFAGPGNNGGDGLALARMLHQDGFNVETYLVADISKISEDCRINYERLHIIDRKHVRLVKVAGDIPVLGKDMVIIDALFGSGLSRSLEGIYMDVVTQINASGAKVVAVDIPSGLFCENNKNNNRQATVEASQTISFQFPKLAFFLPENAKNVGHWKVRDIGLHAKAINEIETDYQLLDKQAIARIYKTRDRFSHKGTFGHALIMAGSYCKMGAAVLASKGCLRSGVGLVTTHSPQLGYQILQTAVPEVMVCADRSEILISEFPDLKNFDAIGIGPGIGTKKNTVILMDELLKASHLPMVIDADGLNILAQNKDWYHLLKRGTVLTPHPGEFERMAGPFKDNYDRLQKAKQFAEAFGVVLVLKGAYTLIVGEDGQCLFNDTGNNGMATAGSGDVLTGIITGLLAQGYEPKDAAVMGVWSHGLAGDCYVQKNGAEALTATDIIDNLGQAFLQIAHYKK